MARRTRRSRRHEDSQGFTWMLLGLGLGLLVAAAVYFSGWRVGDGFGSTAASRERPVPRAPVRPPADDAIAPERTGSSGRTSAAGGQTTPAPATTPEERRFDFYDILPQYELVVPEVETVTRTTTPPAAVAAPGSYILQTGSFRSHDDADRMQASLALLGIESRIQRVTIDADVFHRVRVGPISDLDQLNRLRAQLRGAGVDSLMMKVNE